MNLGNNGSSSNINTSSSLPPNTGANPLLDSKSNSSAATLKPEGAFLNPSRLQNQVNQQFFVEIISIKALDISLNQTRLLSGLPKDSAINALTLEIKSVIKPPSKQSTLVGKLIVLHSALDAQKSDLLHIRVDNKNTIQLISHRPNTDQTFKNPNTLTQTELKQLKNAFRYLIPHQNHPNPIKSLVESLQQIPAIEAKGQNKQVYKDLVKNLREQLGKPELVTQKNYVKNLVSKSGQFNEHALKSPNTRQAIPHSSASSRVDKSTTNNIKSELLTIKSTIERAQQNDQINSKLHAPRNDNKINHKSALDHSTNSKNEITTTRKSLSETISSKKIVKASNPNSKTLESSNNKVQAPTAKSTTPQTTPSRQPSANTSIQTNLAQRQNMTMDAANQPQKLTEEYKPETLRQLHLKSAPELESKKLKLENEKSFRDDLTSKLLRLAVSSIAKIQSKQLSNLVTRHQSSRDAGLSNTLQIDLPFIHNNTIENIELEIRKMGEKSESQPEQHTQVNQWQLSLKFEIENLGKLQIDTILSETPFNKNESKGIPGSTFDVVSDTTIWSENSNTHALVSTHQNKLNDALSRIGLKSTNIMIREGIPPKKDQTYFHSFLDVRT